MWWRWRRRKDNITVVEWWTRKDDNTIVVASVKERENNITLLVWREDDQKIVGAMAMVEEGRQNNHGGVGELEARQSKCGDDDCREVKTTQLWRSGGVMKCDSKIVVLVV